MIDNLPDGCMGASVRDLTDRALRDLGGCNGSRHDLTLGHVWDLVRYGAAGLTGTATALSLLKHEFVEAVWDDGGHRGTRELAGGEFDRMVMDGARRVAALSEGDLAAVGTALRAMEPGGHWHPDTVRVWAGGPAVEARVTRLLSNVEPTKVSWLWRPWLPLGKVSILEGDPDVGKSLLTLAMAAIVSTGSAWPETHIGESIVSQQESKPAGVVLVGVEDDEEDTIVPRLIAAGADRTRIATIRQPTDDCGNPRPFLIPDDVERLHRAVDETGAQLVVIDPITAYLSTRSVKANDDPSTRQALMPLVNLARETGCAILLVRHLNKATGMSAKHRGSGTIAYTGITRSVIVAGKLKETKPNGPTHAIALTKGNLTKDPNALGYKVNGALEDPDTPIVQWLGAVDLNADQLVGADGAKVADARKAAPVREECECVLRELLVDGPMRVDEVVKKTRDVANCSAKPVRDAADRIGIIKRAIRIDNKIDHWTWELPPKVHLRLVEGDVDDE